MHACACEPLFSPAVPSCHVMSCHVLACPARSLCVRVSLGQAFRPRDSGALGRVPVGCQPGDEGGGGGLPQGPRLGAQPQCIGAAAAAAAGGDDLTMTQPSM